MYRKNYRGLLICVTAGEPVSAGAGTDYFGELFMHRASIYFTDETVSDM
ncbi:MAG TPA: hypothetical protein VF534_14435 [Paraburkholderia sp.]